jgi:ABC-type uncharacterized transport system auxiliary subunit
MKSAAFLAVLSLSLGGCVSLLPQAPPAPRLFTIAPDQGLAPAAALGDVVIAVARPNAPRSLSGRDIAWRRGAELAFIDNAAWDGSAPELLHSLLIDTLDRRAGARAIVRVADGSRADFEIRWELVRFEIEETDRVQSARIELTARLLGADARDVRATRRFVAQAPLADRSTSDAAEGLGAVARDAMAQIADWLDDAVPAQASAASSSR